MTEPITVPAWYFWFIGLLFVLMVVREIFSSRRDDAIRDLWKMYLNVTGETTREDVCTNCGIRNFGVDEDRPHCISCGNTIFRKGVSSLSVREAKE